MTRVTDKVGFIFISKNTVDLLNYYRLHAAQAEIICGFRFTRVFRVSLLTLLSIYSIKTVAKLYLNYQLTINKLSISFAPINMNVYKNTEELPVFKNAVITIGTFDGVHLGHMQIIGQLIKEAENVNGTPVLITFYPHPKQVVASVKKPIFILNTPEEKFQLLHKAGIDNIVVVSFDEAFSNQSALSYISEFLVKKFHPHTVIIGYDHRFGKDRQGDYKLLEEQADKFGYIVKEIPERILQDVTISSTRIREALLAGDIETANEFLGYHYFFTGKVVEGNKLGRTIGYPTANLEVDYEGKLIPGNAVYAVDVEIEGIDQAFKGMMNIGMRPTVDGTKKMIEVNIFDFDQDIYGSNVQVSLKKRLRGEVKFNGLDELKAQLGRDKEESLKV
ncbi:MAG: bifunctional riboflavin kinase/FAD synthetase [Ferruginibacter sp.]